ncbi:MAG: hypothetical protein OFPII_11380 [Osedax symbiont Rs1]|nr:MAG: hypothetical protein OFPII_11380 [Osedax symbiont Rs1]
MKLKFKFPTAYTILFVLIAVVAMATWIVPAGQYERISNEKVGREVPVPGTYKLVEQNPQDFYDVVMAPVAGFYDPSSYDARAIDVALFVIIIGGFLAVVSKTGAIDAGISRVMSRLKGREKWMIPILMGLFAAGGTIYGMAEETLAFYMIIIPVMISARYDAITGVAIIMLGAGVGTLGSTINPFSTVIASNAAGIAFTEGIVLRFILLFACWLACVIYVMRYAEKVKNNPELSLVADKRASNEAHFLKGKNGSDMTFTGKHKIILSVFALSFGVMIWGVSVGGWWMAEMSALFIVAAIVIGFIDWMGEEEFTTTFVDGARDLLGVALVIGIARGIVVIMDAGNITDTILFYAEGAVAGLGEIAFINTMFGLQAGLSFLVPSSSGLAVLTMPIMAPLGDFSGVDRSLIVTAFQAASGLVNLINPTFAVVMGGLALGRVSYSKWLKFMWPLLLILTVIIMIGLSVSVAL